MFCFLPNFSKQDITFFDLYISVSFFVCVLLAWKKLLEKKSSLCSCLHAHVCERWVSGHKPSSTVWDLAENCFIPDASQGFYQIPKNARADQRRVVVGVGGSLQSLHKMSILNCRFLLIVARLKFGPFCLPPAFQDCVPDIDSGVQSSVQPVLGSHHNISEVRVNKNKQKKHVRLLLCMRPEPEPRIHKSQKKVPKKDHH